MISRTAQRIRSGPFGRTPVCIGVSQAASPSFKMEIKLTLKSRCPCLSAASLLLGACLGAAESAPRIVPGLNLELMPIPAGRFPDFRSYNLGFRVALAPKTGLPRSYGMMLRRR